MDPTAPRAMALDASPAQAIASEEQSQGRDIQQRQMT
jgi:hypothetical protein